LQPEAGSRGLLAVVLAGQRDGLVDPLAAAAGATQKCLVRIGGLPLIAHVVKALLNEAGVVIGPEFETEYSHHYGIAKFFDVGAVIISCINRDYCKKIIVQMPGQKHPSHFHKIKEETFQVLYGTLEVEVDGHRRQMNPGDTALVQPGVWHRFWSDTGCVFEEISTRAIKGDSVYADKRINKMQLAERKTVVDHWGRFQMKDGSLSWTS